MEEQFAAVTAATGALGPVLKKLNALLGDDKYKLQEETQRDIMSIISELEPLHHLLAKLWWREDVDVACKAVMMDAQELSYDMEDHIDGFTRGLDLGETMESPFKEFMEGVKGVAKRRGKMQKIANTIVGNCTNKLTTDPRALFLHKDASELVGMEEKKEKVIELLQKHEMVCIVGFAGMGKTTLADLVYHAIGDEFQCRVFVSLHPSPNMKEILGTIRSQVTNNAATSAGSGTEAPTEEHLIKDTSISLSDKRYLVIIDDVWHWEQWEVIRKALPKNNLGCKLIMTTRIESIAEKCQTEQGAHVYTQWFGSQDAEKLSDMILNKFIEGRLSDMLLNKFIEGELSDMILNKVIKGGIIEAKAIGLSTMIVVKMCEAMPLAVICLLSAWAEGHVQSMRLKWLNSNWTSPVLDEGYLSTPSFKPLVQSLWLYLDDLPVQLRTCLLYCSIYPRDYMIERVCLVRKWIAEGFASRQEVAEAYFEELVCRNLLLQLSLGSYTVHPVIRAFLVFKAKEDNFIAYNGPGNSSHARQIFRRLSLSYMHCYPDEDVRLSHTRSLVVSNVRPQRMDAAVQFNKFKNLRVLEINNLDVEYGHLADICGLISLRYLGLKRCSKITELPQEIGRLQNLETLYLSEIDISKLPMEIGELERLEALSVCFTEKITELRTWIENLQSLKTLDISYTNITKLPREIKKLERLETLDISWTKVTELPTWIEKLQNLKTLDISRTGVKDLPKEIEKLQHLRTLNISGTMVTKLPREIMGLYRLENLDVSWTVVREIPKEIVKLQHFRTLDIRMTKVRELSWEAPNSLLSVFVRDRDMYCIGREVKVLLCAISSGDEEAVISSNSEAMCREDLSILVLFNHLGRTCEVVPVPMLRVARTRMNIPQWVKQNLSNVRALDIKLVCKLGDGDLEFLKQMPNLQVLQLRLEVLPREPIAITSGGFSKLDIFYVDCRLPRVITFEHQAMPKLRHLEFKFYSDTASQENNYSIGIIHLRSLDTVVFRSSEYYTSDSPAGICSMIDAVRKEAAEHPNEITLWVNDDMEPEIFGSGVRWISQADKAIIEKEKQDALEKEEKERQDAIKKIEKENQERGRIIEKRRTLFWAAERRLRAERQSKSK